MMNKIKYTIDVVLISFSLIVVLLFFNNITPMAIAPLNNEEVSTNSVLFEIRNANYILIDENENFSSPEKIFLENYLEVSLSPGTYYWKIYDDRINEIRKITVLSKVDLTLRKSENSSDDLFEVINSGTEKLNVDVYDKDVFVESFSLDSLDSVVKNGTKFIGGKI
jgi:hypothetical protein